ncbi:MAG: ribose 5-phosphate isomerase B [Eubacterium aggregans]|uniref:ribose 5-phosphate isomerase B n=1 Tax=Eubacterium aggregans TaxID=81409 RepID=UPI0023F45EB5|nr:ribose 5-phosphate isomerase B [Eubacterium aggregans]MDD4692710.1 ribose 5-phosphate isomerase B [Eubacterium aggregans]MEA5073644.1 ribose 5-phosphate isomerase B [Eubacterium aggregans]
MKIAIGSDHGGYELKEVIKALLSDEGIKYMDLGPENEESVDYPVYGQKVAEAVAGGQAERGIAICGTGVGISIAVNKIPGIRGSLCTNEYMAEMTRRHNDSNVLVLGGRVLGTELAKAIVKKWLYTEFEGGRHQRRLDEITAIEEKYNQ